MPGFGGLKVLQGFKNLYKDQGLERRVIALYTVGAIVLTLIFAAMISAYGAPELGISLVLICLNTGPVFALLRQDQDITRASYYLLGHSAFTLTFAVAFVGGLFGTTAYWISILPLAGGLLLRMRGIIVASGLAALSCLVLALRPLVPGVQDLVVPDGLYMAIGLGCFISMLSFMSFCYVQGNAEVLSEQTLKLNRLLNIVTHDITNPLTLISGHAELLIAQGQTSPAQTKTLQRITRASELINEILHNVRQIQAAKAGKLSIQTQPVRLRDIFDKLSFVFEPRLQQKKQRLRIDLPAAYQDVHVQADPIMLLNEVLSNLMSNAIKFSPLGSTITLRVAGQQEFLRIEIQDQGIGIPGNLLPHVFDDARPTSRHGTEGEVGTGFGLPLARHIAESFGGSLCVASQPGEGSNKGCGTVFVLLLRMSDCPLQVKVS